MKYGFIGCGNMGGAIARALSKSTRDICVSDRSGRAKALAEELGIRDSDPMTVARTCDRIFLGVKPHMIKGRPCHDAADVRNRDPDEKSTE